MSETPEERAAQFLLRSEQPDWSAADESARDAWLEESMAHKAAYWRLKYGWAKIDRMRSLRPSVRPAMAMNKPFSGAGWSAAFMCVMMVIAFSPLAFLNRSSQRAAPREAYATDIGQHSSVRLRDGTTVDLNTQTKVYASADYPRELWIERGEVYLQVAHDPAHPFIVHSGDHKVAVLGTKFGVRQDARQLAIFVTEGRVVLSAEKSREALRGFVLEKGDIATTRGEATLIEHRGDAAVNDRLGWRQGYIIFDRTTLADAANEFNRYNRQKIHIVGPQAATIQIGGAFRAENVESFIRLVTLAYGVRVERTADTIQISTR